MNLRLKLFALLMTFLLLAAAPLVSCGQMQNAKQDAVGFDRMRSGERTEKSEPVTIKWASFALATRAPILPMRRLQKDLWKPIRRSK